LVECRRRGDAGFDEVTGMLPVAGTPCLFVMALPHAPAVAQRVVISHSFFEIFMLQAAELSLLRGLGAAGIPAIYIQAPGQGDSEGAPEDCLCEDRVEAAMAAFEHLSAEAGDGRPCFFGARLGGLISLRAAQEIGVPASLCVWDPVLDGNAYWKRVSRLERIAATVGRRTGFQDPELQLSEWGRVTLLGVETTPEQLTDLESTAKKVGRSARVDGAALAVLLNEGSAGPARSVLGGVVDGALQIVTLGIRDPWQLGLRRGEGAVGPTISWVQGATN
jgi:hypothetical protein